MDAKPRIALLIDADNAQASKIDAILTELSSFGESNVRRAYGDWTTESLKGWAAILHEKAIRPIQQYAYTPRKNASDIALAVDAIDLLHTDRPDAFAIVSSDADFTPLVTVLRQRGAAVYGFGESKTPSAFSAACSRFLRVDQLADPDSAVAGRSIQLASRTAELKGDASLVRLLRSAVLAAADETGWSKVSTVGQHISNQSSFAQKNYGFNSLSKLIKATDLFDLMDEGTGGVAVRDKRQAKQAK